MNNFISVIFYRSGEWIYIFISTIDSSVVTVRMNNKTIILSRNISITVKQFKNLYFNNKILIYF